MTIAESQDEALQGEANVPVVEVRPLEMILRLDASGLLETAAHFLEQRVANSQSDATLLKRLESIYRKQGRLEEAAHISRLLVRDHRKDIPSAVRFCWLQDFLPKDLHQSLLGRVLALSGENFVPSRVGTNEYRPTERTSLNVIGLDDVKADFARRIHAAVASAKHELGFPALANTSLEVGIRVYRDGGFFGIHNDAVGTTTKRIISFVYFFHPEPRQFSGGDLILFDSDCGTKAPLTDSFTRVRPVSNALILFPSAAYHAVLPLGCPDAELSSARLVINGHVHAA